MPENDFRKALGKAGEKLALRFLEERGYRLLRANYTLQGGQIDLIMYSPLEILVFVEVKTRTAARRPFPAGGQPECRLSGRQIRALRRAAGHFLWQEAPAASAWQFDLIWLDLDWSVHPARAKIKHLQNILEK